MPRSDDAYDLVHTYDQAKAGKSKTARPAVRELGRDGAPVRLFVQEVRDPALVNTPPSGVRYVFVDQNGDLRRKNPDGSDELAVPTAPTDASYLTVDSEAALTDERELTTSSRVSVTDNGPDSTAELDVVEGQIEAGNLAGSTGSAGQVLTTDGTDASFGAGPQNAPDWTEDPNSPLTVSNAQSGTITLSSTYTLVRLIGRVRNGSSTSQQIGFQVNGNTSNYTVRADDGSDTVGISSARLTPTALGTSQELIGSYTLMGDFTANWGAVSQLSHDLSFDGVTKGSNVTVSPPINTVSLVGSADVLDAEFKVYGLGAGVSL
jgi:hypothetical protein